MAGGLDLNTPSGNASNASKAFDVGIAGDNICTGKVNDGCSDPGGNDGIYNALARPGQMQQSMITTYV